MTTIRASLAAFRFLPLYALTIFLGALLALGLHKIWSLEARFFTVIVTGIVLVSLSVFFLRRFNDFLFACFLFSIPFTAFVKTLFFTSLGYDERLSGILIYSGVIGIGPADILLWGLYAMWFIRIFISRTARLPHLEKADVTVLLLVAAYLLSIPGTVDTAAAVFAVAYLLRFVMVYFYVSRNFDSRHVRWALIVLAAIIVGEALLAGYQFLTGKLIGLAMDRGAGVRLNEQYAVPGIEHRNRATGTSCESHTFGLFMSMLVQFAFVLVCWCFHHRRFRILSSALLGLGLIAVLLSFSRSAWLSCACAMLVAWYVHLFIWREREIMTISLIIGAVALFLSPWALQIVLERFFSAEGLLSARFAQFPIAWKIWSTHLLTGFGVGNYMEALQIYNKRGVLELPVHNAFLWLAAETGIIGVVAFFGTALLALKRSWRLVRRQVGLNSRIALAAFCAVLAYLLDGLTDPLYREPTVFMFFWVSVGLTLALTRINRDSYTSSASTPSGAS